VQKVRVIYSTEFTTTWLTICLQMKINIKLKYLPEKFGNYGESNSCTGSSVKGQNYWGSGRNPEYWHICQVVNNSTNINKTNNHKYMSKRPYFLPKRSRFFFTIMLQLFFQNENYFTKTPPLFYCQYGTFNIFFSTQTMISCVISYNSRFVYTCLFYIGRQRSGNCVLLDQRQKIKK
jgi:hypothetical protein